VGLTQGIYLPLIGRNSAPVASVAITNGNFDSGDTAWTDFSSNGVYPIITHAASLPVLPYSGSYAAWMGGLPNEVNYVQQQVAVPANAPYLRFYHWMASADAPGFDFGRVKVNGLAVETFDLSKDTNGWVVHTVNLTAYAGQSVSLRFEGTTDGSLNSNWFVDEVSFHSLP
jgi:hypothetical protein